ncbi:MAG: secondary thiamine-phosphate synthase enzyme YjbQ [Hyphomicrobiaceae bacterium]|nr:secondary thiamine-phosphate synthase enzyme YjbQ [Hyphomicrobiaceae bacterium]
MSQSKQQETEAAGKPSAVAGSLIQASETLRVATRGPGFSDITAEVAGWLQRIDATEGVVTLLVRHTSASLLIQENADPDVQRDLADALRRLAPEGSHYRHDSEGPDDMPAHIKAMVMPVSLAIPVAHGRMRLGTWQGIYLAEHRRAPHRREIALHYIGS